MTIRGTVYGRTIELENDPGIPDGQVVEIDLRELPAASGNGDGVTTPFAEAADADGSAPVELPLPGGVTSEWVIAIHPLTHKAAETLPDQGLLVSQFPLRIGRASDAREAEAGELNDLWLLDQKPYHVSRNHCEIVVDGKGPYVRDRGSHLGCVVNDTPIGARGAAEFARLEPGENVVVIGSRMSKYQFRVVVSVNGEG